MAIYQFKYGRTYSFQAYAGDILGVNHQNYTLAAIMDATEASRYIDVQALHRQIYPSLPPGEYADNPSVYQYLKFRRTDKTEVLFAAEWINTSTVSEVTNTEFTVTIRGVAPQDEARLRGALTTNNFKDFTIVTTTS